VQVQTDPTFAVTRRSDIHSHSSANGSTEERHFNPILCSRGQLCRVDNVSGKWVASKVYVSSRDYFIMD